MKAIAKLRPQDGAIELIDMPKPVPGPGEALIQIEAGGICGTDIAIRHWYTDVVGQYAPSFPLIIGHEFGGRLVQAPKGSRLVEGAVVAVNPQIGCAKCYYCGLGRQTLCINRRLMGGHIHGGWTEFVTVPEQNIYPLPEGVDATISPLLEPLCVATHAVCDRVVPKPGDVVAVVGPGPIGLLCMILALDAGASNVVITGVGADRARLDLARELGAVAINVEETDPVPVIQALQEDGADIVYETSGSHLVLGQALAMLRRTGRAALIGLCHGESQFKSNPIVLRELEVIGSRGYNPPTWSAMMRVLPRVAPQVMRLLSHTISYDRFEDALDLVERREGIKVILRPSL